MAVILIRIVSQIKFLLHWPQDTLGDILNFCPIEGFLKTITIVKNNSVTTRSGILRSQII